MMFSNPSNSKDAYCDFHPSRGQYLMPPASKSRRVETATSGFGSNDRNYLRPQRGLQNMKFPAPLPFHSYPMPEYPITPADPTYHEIQHNIRRSFESFQQRSTVSDQQHSFFQNSPPTFGMQDDFSPASLSLHHQLPTSLMFYPPSGFQTLAPPLVPYPEWLNFQDGSCSLSMSSSIDTVHKKSFLSSSGSDDVRQADYEKLSEKIRCFVYPLPPPGLNPNTVRNEGYYVKFLLNKCVVVDVQSPDTFPSFLQYLGNQGLTWALSDPYKMIGDRWCVVSHKNKDTVMTAVLMIVHYCRRKFLKKRASVDNKIRNECREGDKKLQQSYTRTTFKFLCDVSDPEIRPSLRELETKVESCPKGPEIDDKCMMNQYDDKYNIVSATMSDFDEVHHAVGNYLNNQLNNIDSVLASGEVIEDSFLRCFLGDEDEKGDCLFGIVSAVKTNPDTAMSIVHRVTDVLLDANKMYGVRSGGQIPLYKNFSTKYLKRRPKVNK